MKKPVVPVTVGGTVSQLVRKMGGTAFQGRNLARGVDIWSSMLEADVTIFMGLAGAMIPAGMRQVMVYLIEKRLIDCLVSTGANLFHDLHETLGRPHYQGSADADDRQLAKSKTYRIYDVLASEEEFDSTEQFVTDFSQRLDPDHAYTTREFFFLLGSELAREGGEDGILSAAARANVPIYCPAIGDSVYGTGLATALVKRGRHVVFDVIADIVEMVHIACAAGSTGVIYIGGGTPKNFIQQVALCGHLFDKVLKGHEYAIQVTTDSPQWGGLSGCTFDEARSWRKVTPDAATVTVHCDATIALPLMVSAVAERVGKTLPERKKPSFRLDRDLTVL